MRSGRAVFTSFAAAVSHDLATPTLTERPMLQQFLTTHRTELIELARKKVAQRVAPTPTDVEIAHGVPMFLDQLIAVFEGGGTATPRPEAGPALVASAARHGNELLRAGFTIAQVVHDYGD